MGFFLLGAVVYIILDMYFDILRATESASGIVFTTGLSIGANDAKPDWNT